MAPPKSAEPELPKYEPYRRFIAFRAFERRLASKPLYPRVSHWLRLSYRALQVPVYQANTL